MDKKITKFMLNALRWAEAGNGMYNGLCNSFGEAQVEAFVKRTRQWAKFDVSTGEILCGSENFDYTTLERYLSAPMYLANAFSLQMLADMHTTVDIDVVDSIPLHLDSAIGHQDTANVLGVPMNRINVSLQKGDRLYVAQLVGGRLPEGSTTLPEGFSLKYYQVRVR